MTKMIVLETSLCNIYDTLLYKLNHYGIKDNAFKLLKSYLTDRQQFVVFKTRIPKHPLY